MAPRVNGPKKMTLMHCRLLNMAICLRRSPLLVYQPLTTLAARGTFSGVSLETFPSPTHTPMMRAQACRLLRSSACFPRHWTYLSTLLVGMGAFGPQTFHHAHRRVHLCSSVSQEEDEAPHTLKTLNHVSRIFNRV